MVCLSLDQSSTVTGVAVGSISDDIHGGYLFGSIKAPNSTDIEGKLAHIYREIDKLIREHSVDEIVYEEPFFPVGGTRGKKEDADFTPAVGMLPAEQRSFTGKPKSGAVFSPDTIRTLQKVVGVIQLLAGLHGIPAVSYGSRTWPITALRPMKVPKGRPERKRAMMLRAKQLGYAVTRDDESDAIGLLIHHFTGPEAAKRKQGDLLAIAGQL